MSMTVAALEERTGITIDEHLAREIDIPVLTGVPQRQGDILFIPEDASRIAATPIPQAGYPVVRGENGGNTHALHTDTGRCFYDPASGDGQRLGRLTVDHGSVAVLSHPEHGFMAFGPGTYTVNRQREQADEIRMVAD